ncbi:hypothetical protein CP532_2034 [Ophiocordyceps camponoti-leonardi (nom. inval.)]|nr:hypothetical protein CP532_2034 [Ophiocordyceps camponoti-leonardi (nom. inval.)]
MTPDTDTTTTTTTTKEPQCKPQPQAGSAIYTPSFLRIYDGLVHGFTNRFVWRCSTEDDLVPLFESALGRRHVDVGVGTGFFPSRALEQQLLRYGGDEADGEKGICESITLIDLNENALQKAQSRILSTGTTAKITTLKANILHPPLPFSVPLLKDNKFDSVTTFYLLHCLPGPPEAKIETVLSAVVPLLSSDGVLVGATVLGRGKRLSLLARALMALYNRWGIFGNADDSEEVFRRALVRRFRHVDVWCVGAVMLFRARGPRVVVDEGE